tara:strand:+ start:104 stop:517 length:414 start_codon:yes stop_codon:yes gene_type:complete
MKPKRNRSIGLIIRRFIAIFILFTTVLGIISSIEENTFSDETIGSAFVSLLIVYYLARSPRKNRQNLDIEVEKTNNNELEDNVDMEELLEDFEENLKEIESEEVKTSYKSERINKNNPVKDNQSFISRIFQGRTDRY